MQKPLSIVGLETAVVILVLLAVLTTGTLVPFESCGALNPTLNVTTVDSTFDESTNTLNFTIKGYMSTAIAGFNAKNIATAFTTASVSNTQLHYDRTDVCNITDGGCPFGPGLITIRKSIQLGRSIPLSTLETNFKAYDEASHPITCLTYSISPQYRYYNPIFTYVPVSVTVFTFLVNVLASFFNPEKFTYDLFAITSNTKLSPLGYRLRTPGLFDVLYYTQFAVSTAELGLNYPGYYPAFMSHFGWASLAFNHSTFVDLSNGNRPFVDANSESVFDMNNMLLTAPSLTNDTYSTPSNSKRTIDYQLRGFMKRQQQSPTVVFTTSTQTVTPTGADVPSPTYPTTNTYLPQNYTVYDNISSVLEKFKGMGNYAVMVGIAPQDFFLETFILAVLIIICVALLSAIAWGVWELLRSMKPHKFRGDSAKGLAFILGNMLRFFLLFYFPILSTAFYQIVMHEYSPLYAVLIAVVVIIILCLALPVFITTNIIGVTPDSILLSDSTKRLKYGPLYNTLKEDGLLFFIVFWAFSFARGLIVGAAQSSGLAQSVILCVLEMVLLILLIARFPYMENTGINNLNITMGVIRTLISGFLLLFISDIGISDAIRDIVGYIIIFFHGLAYVIFALLSIGNFLQLTFRWCGLFKEKDENNIRPSSIEQLTQRMGFRPYSGRDSGIGPDKPGRMSDIPVGKPLRSHVRHPSIPINGPFDLPYEGRDSMPSVYDEFDAFTDESGGTLSGHSFNDPNGVLVIGSHLDEKYVRPARGRNKIASHVQRAQDQSRLGTSLGLPDSNALLAYGDMTGHYGETLGSNVGNTPLSSALFDHTGGFGDSPMNLQQMSDSSKNSVGYTRATRESEMSILSDPPHHARQGSAGSGVLGHSRTNSESGATRPGAIKEPSPRFLGNNPGRRRSSSSAVGAFGTALKNVEDPLELGRISRQRRPEGEESEISSLGEDLNNDGGIFDRFKKIFKGNTVGELAASVVKKKNKKNEKEAPSFWVKRQPTLASMTDNELAEDIWQRGRGPLVIVNPDPAGHSDFGDSDIDLSLRGANNRQNPPPIASTSSPLARNIESTYTTSGSSNSVYSEFGPSDQGLKPGDIKYTNEESEVDISNNEDSDHIHQDQDQQVLGLNHNPEEQFRDSKGS